MRQGSEKEEKVILVLQEGLVGRAIWNFDNVAVIGVGKRRNDGKNEITAVDVNNNRLVAASYEKYENCLKVMELLEAAIVSDVVRFQFPDEPLLNEIIAKEAQAKESEEET